jgi:hypothetical protein
MYLNGLVCSMIVLYKNLRPLYKGRQVRVWNLTLLSWERETTRAQDANEADVSNYSQLTIDSLM